LRQLLESGFRLGAQIHVSYSDEYSALIQNPDYDKTIEYLSRREPLWLMLARDRVDGVVASQLTGLYEIQELGLTGTVIPSSLVVSNRPAYFVFSKATVTAGFVADFDRALQSMLDDGTFTAIVNRYVCVDAGAGLSGVADGPGACSPAEQ
jgi:polar amino acid transport system substrate-binding protein